jgi:hypothetical protein
MTAQTASELASRRRHPSGHTVRAGEPDRGASAPLIASERITAIWQVGMALASRKPPELLDFT